MASIFDNIRRLGIGPIDAGTTDLTPKVSVEINGVEYDRIGRYCYDQDVLQLGDPMSVALPDPHLQYVINRGDSLKLFMADPLVAGGKRTQMLTGLVTKVQQETNPDAGTMFTVSGADLGYHLTTSDAPIWKRLEGLTFGQLFDRLVSPKWGFTGFANENDRNIRLKQSGNYVRARFGGKTDANAPIPVVQVEPGDKPADIFIQYAKLVRRLVNVSFDGFLQLFEPNYVQTPAYRFYNYRDNGVDNLKNNVQSATLTQSLDTIWTKAVCVGTRLVPVEGGTNQKDPNANSFRGTYEPSPAPLGFDRLVAFGDADRLNSNQAAIRAKWKIQRGQFDAWIYEIVVKGHSQNGLFYQPDTMCEVHDTILGVEGKFYISAVQMARDEGPGTTSKIQIRLPNLLSA